MWSQLLDWAFHWTLLWLAFELGKKWNEKDVAASIAALTERQSRRRSSEIIETPMRVSRCGFGIANDRNVVAPEGARSKTDRRRARSRQDDEYPDLCLQFSPQTKALGNYGL